MQGETKHRSPTRSESPGTTGGLILSGIFYVKEGRSHMAKQVTAQEAKRAPVQVMVTEAVREQVEQIARREDVSLSEIGRRAIEKYVEAEHA